jgi:hypothetical protein
MAKPHSGSTSTCHPEDALEPHTKARSAPAVDIEARGFDSDGCAIDDFS